MVEEKLGSVRALAAESVIVGAVKNQNAKGKTLHQIRAVEIGWVLDSEKNPRLYRLLNCDCADRLRDFAGADSSFKEVLVMDNQGALVCMTAKTTDYWQGDEGKWQKTYSVGPDAVFIDDVDFDDSTESFQSQVSATIVDPASGKPIGAITIGLNVENL